MIIKVLFKLEGEPVTMMFGTSYKPWQEQYWEYFSLRRNETRGLIEPIEAWSSKSPWIGFGGLKWCHEEDFQGCLNREDCQTDDPDNPKPRKYADMKFTEMPLSKLPTRPLY